MKSLREGGDKSRRIFPISNLDVRWPVPPQVGPSSTPARTASGLPGFDHYYFLFKATHTFVYF